MYILVHFVQKFHKLYEYAENPRHVFIIYKKESLYIIIMNLKYF